MRLEVPGRDRTAHSLEEGVAGGQIDAGGFGPPAVVEAAGGEGAVLAGSGGDAGRLVGEHAGFAVGGQPAGGGEVGFDGHGPLGERPQLLIGEAGHLPAAVAVRTPGHAELVAEAAAELFLVDRPGRLRPPVQGGGIQSDPSAVIAADQVGDHAVGVELGVALPAGAMHERGRRPTRTRSPDPDTSGLAAGHRGVGLDEAEGGLDRFDMGDRHHRSRLGGPERP